MAGIARTAFMVMLGALSASNMAVVAADFGERTPEVKELVDALTPPERTRGIAIVGASAAASTQASMRVGFDFGSVRVISTDLVKLSRLADALKSETLRAYRYQVIGHTDGVGALALNMRLSQQRATAVVEYLRQQGIPAERLSADGRGPKELINPQHPDAPENRRVEIRLVQ